MTTIYIRKFHSKKNEESDTTKHPISSYFPKIMVAAFRNGFGKNGYIRNEDYIIGPVYRSGDFQIGFTGTVEEKEGFYNAISREMGEEIGLVPKDTKSVSILKNSTYNKEGKKITFTVYDAYIKHCIPVLDHQNNASLSKQKDSRNKVGCFIYGSKKDILHFFNSKIYRYKSTDDIIGLAAIKADDISLFINHFKTKNVK